MFLKNIVDLIGSPVDLINLIHGKGHGKGHGKDKMIFRACMHLTKKQDTMN